MFKVLKLGHVEFEVRDLDKMAEFYVNVLGLTQTDRDGDVVYLSTAVDHHSMIFQQGSHTRLTKIAFQIAPIANADVLAHFRRHGFQAELLSDSQPGLGTVVRTANTDGISVETYSTFEASAPAC